MPFTRRSAPTSVGRCTRMGMGMFPAPATINGMPRRSAIAAVTPLRAGTTDAMEMAVTSDIEAPSRWSRPSIRTSISSAVMEALVAARLAAMIASPCTRPRVMLVLPMSRASSMAR